MEQPVRVRILDHEYLIRSDEDELYVQRVAEFVDESFKKVRENTQGLSETKMAILAAFHIAGEYFQAEKDNHKLKNEIQKRAQALNKQIDSMTK